MSSLNGRGQLTMTLPQERIDAPEGNAMDLFCLRLWMLCALAIVAFGVSNYLLNWFVGNIGR